MSISRRTVARTKSMKPVAKNNRLPREVWIAGISQNRMEARNYEEMIKKSRGRAGILALGVCRRFDGQYQGVAE